jgi:hypothetical protein
VHERPEPVLLALGGERTHRRRSLAGGVERDQRLTGHARADQLHGIHESHSTNLADGRVTGRDLLEPGPQHGLLDPAHVLEDALLLEDPDGGDG